MTVTRKLEDRDVWVYEGQISIPNTYTAGTVGSRFLTELRDNKRIMGMKCPKCNFVYLPPRSTCKYCFDKLNEWTQVGDKGTLLTYAIMHQPSPVQPAEPPLIYGIVQLDGASTGLVHLLDQVDFEKITIGMRVQAVFNENRTASILDIKYFKPVC